MRRGTVVASCGGYPVLVRSVPGECWSTGACCSWSARIPDDLDQGYSDALKVRSTWMRRRMSPMFTPCIPRTTRSKPTGFGPYRGLIGGIPRKVQVKTYLRRGAHIVKSKATLAERSVDGLLAT